MGSQGLWPMLPGMSSSEANTCQLMAVLVCKTEFDLRNGETQKFQLLLPRKQFYT